MTEIPARSRATVEMDRTRRLRYNIAAIEAIEARYDVNIMNGDPLKFSSLDDIVWLAWLGLYHAGETPDVKPTWWQRLLAHFGLYEPPELTRDHVAEWIDMQNMGAVSDAINEAMGGARAGTAKAERGPDPTPAGREEAAA